MKTKHYFTFLLLFLSLLMSPAEVFAQRTKVACIGNSITEGWGLPSGAKPYPTVLQDLLGTTDYEVRNYGVSAHSMLKKSDIPYWNTSQYTAAKNWNPDVLIIKLGTNDAKPVNWDRYKSEFKGDYLDFIKSFTDLNNSKLKVYVCYPFPIFPASNHAGEKGDAVIKDEMMPILTQIAAETGATLIDLHSPFEDKVFLSDDGLHPNTNGAIYLANIVARAVCPTCRIADVPANILTKVNTFDRADNTLSATSSVAGLSDISALLDNNVATAVNTTFQSDMSFEVELAQSIYLTAYSLTAGSTDNATDSPKSWELQAKATGSDAWITIDERTNATFLPNETKYFLLKSGEGYTTYRLIIKENNGNANIRINEWQLVGNAGTLISANGGVISAQYPRTDNEGVQCLIDANPNTKYCVVDKGDTFWLQYNSPAPATLKEYTLTSGNDASERDPVNWTLKASKDGGESWDVLDTQTNQKFPSRLATLTYPVSTTEQYLYFRLEISKIASGKTFQLADWLLYGDEVPRIKIACIGNSITEGMGASSTSNTYPAILQRTIDGAKYEVKNFGASGRTLLKNGKEFDGSASSYWTHPRYQLALDYEPDIVVIKLGTNDAKPVNWNSMKAQYVPDYIDMVNSFKNLPSQPKIYVCYPIPLFGPGNWINDDKVVTGEMMQMIDQVATATGATIIDLHTPFEGRGYLTGDKVHPNDKGYTYLAHLVGEALCPDDELPALPDDLFLVLSTFDQTDKSTNSTASVAGLDMTPMLDNNPATGINMPYVAGSEAWFNIELPVSIKATAYSITSDEAGNAPRTWELQGQNANGDWVKIDEQKDIVFMANETRIMDGYFTALTALRDYKNYRLLVKANNGADNIGIREWQVFGSPVTFEATVTSNGGQITDQFGLTEHEGVQCLNDRDINSKYCAVDKGQSYWIQYKSTSAVALEKYTLTSANDAPGRDPMEWKLEGSINGTNWVQLDKRSNQEFIGRYSTLEYPVNTSNQYTYFRLSISKLKDGSTFQLAEWQLFARGASGVEEVATNNPSTFTIISGDKELTILSGSQYPGEYEVFSLTGLSVCREKIEAGASATKALTPGLYLVALNAKGERLVKKVVVR